MDKKNRRVEMTKRMMKEALFELLKEKEIYKISVKELCEKADVNRTTFYAHYFQPEDVLHEVEKDCINQLMSYLEKLSPNLSSKEYLVEFFNQINENKELYEILIKRNDNGTFINQLRDAYLATTTLMLDRTEYPEYFKEFLISGNVSLLVKWIHDGCDIKAEKLASLLFEINHKFF